MTKKKNNRDLIPRTTRSFICPDYYIEIRLLESSPTWICGAICCMGHWRTEACAAIPRKVESIAHFLKGPLHDMTCVLRHTTNGQADEN